MTGRPPRGRTPPGGAARPAAARGAWLGLILAFWLGAAFPCTAGQGAFRGGVIKPPAPAPDFTLRTAEAKPFRLSEQRGKVAVLYFGYTSCPDVCPMTLAQLADVKTQLGEAAARLRVALVTVDPERDTPKRLRTYTRAFDPSFLGLTGSTEALGEVWKAYGVFAEKKRVAGSPLGYLVDHSATTSIVDAEGQLRLALPFGTETDTFLSPAGGGPTGLLLPPGDALPGLHGSRASRGTAAPPLAAGPGKRMSAWTGAVPPACPDA